MLIKSYNFADDLEPSPGEYEEYEKIRCESRSDDCSEITLRVIGHSYQDGFVKVVDKIRVF